MTSFFSRRRAFAFAILFVAACGGASATDLIGGSDDAGATDASADSVSANDSSADSSDDGFSGDAASDGAIDAGKDARADASDAGAIDASFDASCGDTTTSDTNCGACGYKCVDSRSCVASRCVPAWRSISSVNEPTPRTAHAAAALNGKFYTFGGALTTSDAGATDPTSLASGGVYDPTADSWDVMPALKAARCDHAAVAGPANIYTFGGLSSCDDPSTLGPSLENFDGTQWTTTVVAKGTAPAPRYTFPGVWTGTSFFIYGGSSSSASALNSGTSYTPGTGYADVSDANANGARGGDFGGFVDANYVRFFGGIGGNAPAGLEYDLTTKTWSAWTLPANTPTTAHRAVDNGAFYYSLEAAAATCPQSVNVRIYDKTHGTWSVDTSASPAGLNADAAVAWVGSELIAWSGDCGAGPSLVGGRYQPPAPSP